jgi:hypothetical protein
LTTELRNPEAACYLQALSIMVEEEDTMDSESSQETSLDNWGRQLIENILLTAAEEVGERSEISESIEVTLTFRLRPIISKDQLEVSVAFKRDPTLIAYIPRQL